MNFWVQTVTKIFNKKKNLFYFFLCFSCCSLKHHTLWRKCLNWEKNDDSKSHRNDDFSYESTILGNFILYFYVRGKFHQLFAHVHNTIKFYYKRKIFTPFSSFSFFLLFYSLKFKWRQNIYLYVLRKACDYDSSMIKNFNCNSNKKRKIKKKIVVIHNLYVG